ncbi:MAG: phosphotransferase [Proteobacteria bacterium]|nr:phosphotransferase [Pseudomonadota bacterium]
MSQRIEQIKKWLENKLLAEIKTFEVASADASFRRYFRVLFNNKVMGQIAGQSFIIMDAPPEKENIEPFIEIAKSLKKTGVNVPEIYAVNKTHGFILMSDLGSKAYLSLLNSDINTSDYLYSDAMNALVNIQKEFSVKNPDIQQKLPAYDEHLLKTEMDLLPDWYIKVHCQQTLTGKVQSTLDHAMKLLIISAQEQPQVFVHRDYHSRNLMVCDKEQGGNPGIIDFQDAVIGPITYDLVSLLRDSYIAWPDEKVYAWVEQYRQMLLASQLLDTDNKEQFIRWFDWMGIQRQLKVVGIFCRLNYRDGKNNYLNDIPQTLNYLFKVCSRYTEFNDLLELLKRLDKESKT